MEEMKNIWNGLKPAMLMVLVQITLSALNVIYKLAISDGMSMRVAIAYRLILASAFTIPLALIFDRKKKAKMTWRVLFMAFLCGLFGATLFQNLFFEAMVLTSATFVSAIYNLIPAITFVLAIPFGLEKLNLGRVSGKAKVLGTITGIGGAMVLTFFKGVEINLWSFHVDLLHHYQHHIVHSGSKGLGVLCAVGSCFSFAIWLIIQAKMSKEYPRDYSCTALMSTMGAIQSTVFALCIDRDWTQWKLGWNIRLLAVSFSGIVASGIMVIVIAWCVRMRGPLFASVFNPLLLVIVAIVSSMILNEQLYLGSVVGSVMIVCGLYMVLWGKGKEIKEITEMIVPLEGTQHESEGVEIIVASSPVDDKNIHNSDIAAKDHEDAAKCGHEICNIHNGKSEKIAPTSNISD